MTQYDRYRDRNDDARRERNYSGGDYHRREDRPQAISEYAGGQYDYGRGVEDEAARNRAAYYRSGRDSGRWPRPQKLLRSLAPAACLLNLSPILALLGLRLMPHNDLRGAPKAVHRAYREQRTAHRGYGRAVELGGALHDLGQHLID